MSSSDSGPRRVALVTGQLDWGGAERQLFLYATGLASRGLALEVGCLSDRLEPYGPRLEAAGIPVRAFARRGAFDVGRVLGLRRWIAQSAPEVVASFGEFAAGYVHLALALARSRPRHLAMLRRSALQLGGARRWLVRRAFRGADAVSANSEAGRAYGAAEFGIDARRIAILPNLVPPEILDLRVDRAAVRRELGLAADEPLVCYVGRAARPKDIPTLCRTLAVLEKAGARCTALVIGPGLERHPKGHPDAGSHVLWLGVRPDATRLMGASDVLLLTSRSEGTPNVVLESLALGTPVVSTRAGDVPTLVGSSGAGAIASPGDHEALAAAVLALLADREAARRMGESGRAYVAETFGPERSIGGFLELLRAAAAARR